MIKVEAASGDETGAAIFMSVFLVKICLITISAEQYVRHPVRGSAHLFTDSFQVNTRIAFDDKFVTDVPDDKAVPECLHDKA